MADIQYEVSISAIPNKYVSQHLHTKELITQFEPAQQDRISNKQNNLAENRN